MLVGGSPDVKVEVESTSNAAQKQNGSHVTSRQVDAQAYELACGVGEIGGLVCTLSVDFAIWDGMPVIVSVHKADREGEQTKNRKTQNSSIFSWSRNSVGYEFRSSRFSARKFSGKSARTR